MRLATALAVRFPVYHPPCAPLVWLFSSRMSLAAKADHPDLPIPPRGLAAAGT